MAPPSSLATTRVELKRRFHSLHAMALVSSFIIGTGIYLGPTGVLQRITSPGLALIVWTIMGFVGIVDGIVYAEYATVFPRCGCSYLYLEIFYGPAIGFLQLWMYFLILRPGSDAIKCLLAATYITRYVLSECQVNDDAIRILAVVIMCFITYLNARSVKVSGKFQATCAILTISSLVAIIVSGCIHMAQGHVEHLKDTFEDVKDQDIGDIFLAVYSMLYAYSGGSVLNHLVEEIKNPTRTIPRAIIVVKLTVIVLFVLVNVAFLAVLGPTDIRESSAVAMTFAERQFGRASLMIPLAVAIASIGSLVGGVLLASRLGFAGARRGHLPEVISLLSLRSFAPVLSLIVRCGTIILQVLLFIPLIIIGDFYVILNNIGFLNSLTEVMVTYGYIWHRIKHPEIHRPFKLHLFFHVFYAALCTILVVVPLVTKPREAVTGFLIIVLTGVPYYLLFIKGMAPAGFLQGAKRWLMMTLQKLFIAAPQDPDTLEDLAFSWEKKADFRHD